MAVKSTKCKEKFGPTLDNFSLLSVPEEFTLSDMFSLANVSDMAFFFFLFSTYFKPLALHKLFFPLSLQRNMQIATSQEFVQKNSSLGTEVWFWLKKK